MALVSAKKNLTLQAIMTSYSTELNVLSATRTQDGWRGMYCGYKCDWKQTKELCESTSHYNADKICDNCPAAKTTRTGGIAFLYTNVREGPGSWMMHIGENDDQLPLGLKDVKGFHKSNMFADLL